MNVAEHNQEHPHLEIEDFPTEEAAGWLISYADMVTLLLCFFILLFALYSKKIQENKKVKEKEITTLNLIQNDLKKTFSGLENEKQIKGVHKNPEIHFLQDRQGFLVVFDEDQFFEKSSSELNINGEYVISILLEQLKMHLTNINIEIQGHTDREQESSSMDNMTLGINRAMNVYKYLIEWGIPKSSLSVTGSGSNFWNRINKSARQVSDIQDTEENKINRRITFRVESK